MKFLKSSLFLLLLYFSILPAQWNLNLSNYTSATSNLINNYKNIDDIYFFPQVQIARIEQDFTFYYSGSTIQMLDHSIYNRNFHRLGLNYYRDLTQDLFLSAGSKFSLRRNQDEFAYYDYHQVRSFVSFKYYFLYNLYSKLGASWQYKNFTEEDAWNHHEYSIWTQTNLSLPTRTSLRMYLNYRIRDFSAYDYTVDNIQYSAEISSLWLLISRVRLAQSITPQIGIFSEISYYHNPSEGNPYEIEINSFSPIDDYFGNKGWNWENNLKYSLSRNWAVDLNFEYYERKYLNRPVYSYDFDEQKWILDEEGDYIIDESNRRDNGYNLELSSNYTFDRIGNRAASVYLEAYIYFRHNNSNDPYFEYQDYGTGLNLNYNLQW